MQRRRILFKLSLSLGISYTRNIRYFLTFDLSGMSYLSIFFNFRIFRKSKDGSFFKLLWFLFDLKN